MNPNEIRLGAHRAFRSEFPLNGSLAGNAAAARQRETHGHRQVHGKSADVLGRKLAEAGAGLETALRSAPAVHQHMHEDRTLKSAKKKVKHLRRRAWAHSISTGLAALAIGYTTMETMKPLLSFLKPVGKYVGIPDHVIEAISVVVYFVGVVLTAYDKVFARKHRHLERSISSFQGA
jgi:hypothetical protein